MPREANQHRGTCGIQGHQHLIHQQQQQQQQQQQHQQQQQQQQQQRDRPLKQQRWGTSRTGRPRQPRCPSTKQQQSPFNQLSHATQGIAAAAATATADYGVAS